MATAAPEFDTLAATRELMDAGVERKQAEAVAATVRASRAGLATKADINALESRMQATLYRALRLQTGAIVGTIIAVKLL